MTLVSMNLKLLSICIPMDGFKRCFCSVYCLKMSDSKPPDYTEGSRGLCMMGDGVAIEALELDLI